MPSLAHGKEASTRHRDCVLGSAVAGRPWPRWRRWRKQAKQECLCGHDCLGLIFESVHRREDRTALKLAEVGFEAPQEREFACRKFNETTPVPVRRCPTVAAAWKQQQAHAPRGDDHAEPLTTPTLKANRLDRQGWVHDGHVCHPLALDAKERCLDRIAWVVLVQAQAHVDGPQTRSPS